MIATPVRLDRQSVELFLEAARHGDGQLPAWADERIQWLCENLLWAMEKAQNAQEVQVKDDER